MLSNFKNFVFIIIVIVSCKHGDTTQPQNPSLNCQLTEYQSSSSTNTFIQTYGYNEQSILKEITGSIDISIERNNDGYIKSTDWIRNYTPEFSYDSQGRLKKIVSAYFLPSGAQAYYQFFEYNAKGHLSQSTWIPSGDHGLQLMYNSDIEAFMLTAISNYDTITSYSKRERFTYALKNILCTKYLVDKNKLTVGEIRNQWSDSSPGHRVERAWTVTKYDGRNSPYDSADWRTMNMFLGIASLNGDSFPELGNVLEKTNPVVSYSGDNSQRSYIYNNEGYPISGTYIDAAFEANLTWKYNCK